MNHRIRLEGCLFPGCLFPGRRSEKQTVHDADRALRAFRLIRRLAAVATATAVSRCLPRAWSYERILEVASAHSAGSLAILIKGGRHATPESRAAYRLPINSWKFLIWRRSDLTEAMLPEKINRYSITQEGILRLFSSSRYRRNLNLGLFIFPSVSVSAVPDKDIT